MLDDSIAPGSQSSRPALLVHYHTLNIMRHEYFWAKPTPQITTHHITLRYQYMQHIHTHTHSIISVTFLLGFILCSLNTNTHNQIMVSEPLYSQTGLSACSWGTIRGRISDNSPIYRLWNSSKGPRSSWCLWCVVSVNRHGAWRNILRWMCVTACSTVPLLKVSGEKMSVYEKRKASEDV